MANTPFPVQPALVAAAGLFTNTKLIADRVLPRVAPVGTQAFKYLLHNMADGFTIPDTRVDRIGRPNQVTLGAAEVAGSTLDYSLDIPVPNADVMNAAGQLDPNAARGMDPEVKATLMSKNLIMLDREVRVANLVFALGTYPAANRTTLSGTSQWSDYTNSNPIGAIKAAMDGMLQRPNKVVIGQLAYTTLQQHPKVVSSIFKNAGTTGVVSAEQIAQLLEVDEVMVGQAYWNTARPGQAMVNARAWGKHMAMFYQDPFSGPFDMPSFGYTVPWGDPIAGALEDKNMGMRGGRWVRYGESVAEVIAAPSLGYFFQNCVA